MSLRALFEMSDDAKKLAAWNNATSLFGNEIRIDCDGQTIRWSDHGLCTEFGWQIDHIRPQALGGDDHPSNLRARHWRGNSAAGGLLGGILGGGSFIGGNR